MTDNRKGSRGRSSTHKGRNSNNKSSKGGRRNQNSNAPSREYKFAPYSNNQKGQYHTFETVRESVVAKISSEITDNVNDILTSIEKDQYVDIESKIPKKRTPTADEATQKDLYDTEVEQNNYIFQEEVKRWIKRKEDFENNKRKVYDIVIGFCTLQMKNRLKTHPEYANFHGDPLKTLAVIKQAIHDPVKARYEFASLFEALLRLLTLKQGETEPLLDWSKRFKQAKEVAQSTLGDNFLDNFMERTRQYKALDDKGLAPDKLDDAQKELKQQAFEIFTTYIFLANSDQKKYGSYMQI